MFFSEDLAVIVTCITDKGWTVTRITKEFPSKKWNYRSINRVLGNDFRLHARQRYVTPCQRNSRFFRDNTPDFISSQEWTPHSPDLNPLDCSIWEFGHIARTCLRRKAWTVCKPQRSWHCYHRKWHNVDNQTVRKAILQWKRRLAAVAKQNEGPIQCISAS